MPRVPTDPEWTPNEDWWERRPAEAPGDLTVYEIDAEPAGYLWLPDGTYVEVAAEREPFGYARHLGAVMAKQSILDEIAAAQIGPGAFCTVGKALDAMDPHEREAFETAMAGDYQGTAIAKVMSTRGFRVSAGTVQRHRKNECCCGRR